MTPHRGVEQTVGRPSQAVAFVAHATAWEGHPTFSRAGQHFAQARKEDFPPALPLEQLVRRFAAAEDVGQQVQDFVFRQ